MHTPTNMKTPTPHIGAKEGDFAKVVLMPGDPLRAKWIAETFLVDAKLVTSTRNVLGYTGLTKNGKRVSIMASGMGMPSIGIYSYELYAFYGVETIIRIGTAGAYLPSLGLGDVLLAEGSCTDSNWMGRYDLKGGTYSAIASFDVLLSAYNAAKRLGKKVHVGNVLSGDGFYDADPEYWKKWAGLHVLGVEMESYALYANAATLGKKALCVLTVSNSFLGGAEMSAEQRQTGLVDMVEVALGAAEDFA